MSEQDLQLLEESQVSVTEADVVPGSTRRLFRSRRERVLSGVCGGIAQYFSTDPVLVRAIWVLLSLLTAVVPGVILYIVATLVMPENQGEEAAPRWRVPAESNVLWGGLLVVAGLLLLFRHFGKYTNRYMPELAHYWNILWGTLRGLAWPAVFIGVGLLLFFGVTRNGEGRAKRRLTRSKQDRLVAGVCAGLGNYFQVDPTWVRLAWVLLTLASKGTGLLLYLVAMLAIPEEEAVLSED